MIKVKIGTNKVFQINCILLRIMMQMHYQELLDYKILLKIKKLFVNKLKIYPIIIRTTTFQNVQNP